MQSAAKPYIVIGGGPAGSRLATLLAKEGRETILLEKSNFPRFHIGESLLPASTKIFEELGVLEQMRDAFLDKPGGCWYYDHVPVFSFFADCRSSASFANDPSAFMVERARFDQLLLQNAAAKGAHVREEHEVKDVEIDSSERITKLTIRSSDGSDYQVEPQMVFDCSGYFSFLSRKLKIREINPLKRMAIFAHYDASVVDERVKNGWFVGEMIYDGWIWLIPLEENKISIGVVTGLERYKEAEATKEQFIDRLIAQSPLVKRAFAGPPKRTSEVNLYGNLGYTSTKMYGPNWALAGDAAFFIDPCYSSGVHMALSSARQVAQAAIHSRNDTSTWLSEMKIHEKKMRRHERMVIMLVECFYMASKSKWLRKLIPIINNRRSVYLDFVQFTGGDFSSRPSSIYSAWLTHKLISAIFPGDKKPELLIQSR